MAGQRQLQAATQRRAIDGGDGGLAQLLEPTKLCLDSLRFVEEGLGIFFGHLAKRVEITARKKGLLCRCQHNTREITLRLELLHCLAKCWQKRFRH